ncbi:MAG: mechanosensitive ion channel family protein [Sulfurovum sp.]|jgi:MscS family membrane protein
MIKFLLILTIFLNSIFADDNKNNTSTIEEQLKQNNLYAKEVLTNISNDYYLKNSINFEQINKDINLLQSKVSINKKQGNNLASYRDELEILILDVTKEFELTLNEISDSIVDYKNKSHFENIIKMNIEALNLINLNRYAKIYKENKDINSKIINDFNENYTELYTLINKQTFTLNYLLNNIDIFRKSNFFIEEFNLQNIIKIVDSQSYVKPVSKVTDHYLNITIGEFLVVVFILLFFRLINTKIISIFINYLSKVVAKIIDKNKYDFDNLIKEAFYTPLKFILYTLAIQLSILILVDDAILISQLTPWINTIYMAVLTWIFYKITDNAIAIYAKNLLEKYPNVRKEMIVFILRIFKIILILVVVLFLFSQLGIDIKAIAASLGVGGIAIALASKDTLANFFASLNIMTDNSFSQGDWIKTDKFEGTVVDIRMRTTRVRTFDNALITVPNSEIANSHIMNWSKRIVGRRIKMSIGITYESKMEDIVNLKNDIHEMLVKHEQIANTENVILNEKIKFDVIKQEDLKGVKKTLLVYIDEYAGSSINILIYCFSKNPDWEEWLKTKEDVMIKISQLVEKNNCEFAYPTQTLHLKKDDLV